MPNSRQFQRQLARLVAFEKFAHAHDWRHSQDPVNPSAFGQTPYSIRDRVRFTGRVPLYAWRILLYLVIAPALAIMVILEPIFG